MPLDSDTRSESSNAGASRRNNSSSNKRCASCHEVGHSRRTSKKCRMRREQCSSCGRGDHTSPNSASCPNFQQRTVCSSCGREDHISPNSVVLRTTARQRADSDRQKAFIQTLLHLSQGQVTIDDWRLLMTRKTTTAADRDDPKWHDAVHLFFSNKDVIQHNLEHLQQTHSPITRFTAVNSCSDARRSKSEDAGGLQNVEYMGYGSRVMLTGNLWTEAGLHNGALGYVVDFVYESRDDPVHNRLPKAVIVQFDRLAEGVQFVPNIARTVAVPVTTVRWQTKKGKWVHRTQIPLRLAWAMTIHKSQGKTLDRAVIHLGKSEKCSGLSLVALSRTRNLDDMLIQSCSFKRLQKLNSDGLRKRNVELERLNAIHQQLERRFRSS